MEYPSDFTSFWHAQVVPGKPCHITVQSHSECSITNIALHQDEDRSLPKGNRTILYASVNNAPPVAIVPFTVGQFESTGVDIRFSNSDDVILTTKGAEIAVDVVGSAIRKMPEIDNGVHTDESENAEPQNEEPVTEK